MLKIAESLLMVIPLINPVKLDTNDSSVHSLDPVTFTKSADKNFPAMTETMDEMDNLTAVEGHNSIASK